MSLTIGAQAPDELLLALETLLVHDVAISLPLKAVLVVILDEGRLTSISGLLFSEVLLSVAVSAPASFKLLAQLHTAELSAGLQGTLTS